MGSEDLKLERDADRRLAKEQHHEDRHMNAQNNSGNAALRDAIEPRPKGRFGIRGITLDRPKKKPEYVPAGRIGPPAPPPLRFADALPPMYAPRPRPKVSNRPGGSSLVVMDATTKPLVHAPRVRVYGPAAILADVGRRGIVCTLTTDRTDVAVQVRAKLMGDDLQTLRDAAPLLLAHLRGDAPPECTSGPHTKGQDVAAVSVGPLGALICAAHLAERAS
jgi:hypothetical protein